MAILKSRSTLQGVVKIKSDSQLGVGGRKGNFSTLLANNLREQPELRSSPFQTLDSQEVSKFETVSHPFADQRKALLSKLKEDERGTSTEMVQRQRLSHS